VVVANCNIVGGTDVKSLIHRLLPLETKTSTIHRLSEFRLLSGTSIAY